MINNQFSKKKNGLVLIVVIEHIKELINMYPIFEFYCFFNFNFLIFILAYWLKF